MPNDDGYLTPEHRAALITEVRKHLADIDAHASPDRLGGGRAELWLRALVKEIDDVQPSAPFEDIADERETQIRQQQKGGFHKNDTKADVMKIAIDLYANFAADGFFDVRDDACARNERHVLRLCRALAEYGDRRARDARRSIQDQGWCSLCHVYHRTRSAVEGCPLIQQIKREVRAGAWAEAIVLVDDETFVSRDMPTNPLVTKMRDRALAGEKP